MSRRWREQSNMPVEISSNELNDESAQLPRLPACRFCHSRKTKCDNGRPKCAICVKHEEECLTLEVDEHASFSRQYIGNLEQEIKSLERQLAGVPDDSTDRSPQSCQDNQNLQSHGLHSSHLDDTCRDTRQSPNFIEGGGISFIRHLVADAGWHAHDPTLLQSLTRISGLAEAGIKPNQLPSAEEARSMFDKYGSHVQNPFLLRREVECIYQRIYPPMTEGSTEENAQESTNHNLFRAFMVLAIGSILPYRNGLISHHPYGYYLSAMNHLDDDILSRGIKSIQDLLLVGRFAIYHYIGTSIWEIIRLCMRLCIEQGLHKHPPPSSGTTLINEQLERRVFWECYMIDRYSSITLDRPCAIAERYIEIGFPADANDEELLAADTSGSFTDLDSFCAASSTAPSSTLANTEMSVFFACLRLRQITSRIHSKFCAQDRSRTARNNTLVQGIVYEELDELLSALQQWRQSTPVFHTPQTLYETQEWYDLLYFRERLQLIRKAIDIVPKWNSIPPRELLSLCSESAVGAISAFWQLFESRKITFTRSYFQMLFTAGLSVMYCMSAVKDIDSESIRAGIDAVTKCEEILKKMGVNLPDAKRYIAVYESLSEYVIRKCSRNSREEVQYRPQEWFPSNPHEQTIPSISTMTTNERHAPSNLPEILVESAPFIRHYGLASTGTHGTSENMSSSDNCTNVQLMTGAYSSIYPDAPLSEGSVLTCDIFADDALWSMEAGLNEYAYGDPPAILYLNDAFDPQSFV